MNSEQIITIMAELDGYTEIGKYIDQRKSFAGVLKGKLPHLTCVIDLPDYLYSRDAVIRVLEAQPPRIKENFIPLLDMETKSHREKDKINEVYVMVTSPARQMCIALIKAAGKWE